MPSPDITDSPLITEPKPATSNTSHKAYTLPGRPFALFSTLPYYTLYLVYIVGFIAVRFYFEPYIMTAIVYLGFPLLDYLSYDWLNPDREQQKALENNIWFKGPLFGLILVDNIGFFYALYMLTTLDLPLAFYPGTIFLTASVAGHHFLAAHEIFHKRDTFSKVAGTMTIMKSLYMHFYIEHNFGHHKKVGTYEDPATARYGESIYQFLPRTLIGSYRSAWDIEKKRMIQLKGYKTHWVVQNRMIWFTLSYFLLPVIVWRLLGFKGLFIYLMLVAISITIFETTNYIEHYGLIRKKIGPNEYEQVNITHSWNAPQRFSNYLLFKLQRHSDHHENSYKPYQILLSKDESPILPHGYMMCQIISFFPSIWFRIMDRMLLAYREKRPLTAEEVRLNNKDSRKIFYIIGSVLAILGIFNYYSFQVFFKE